MKKNFKIISLLVAAILLVGAVIGISVSAEETDTTPGVRIAGQNLAYEGAVQVLYLVEAKNDEGYTPKLIVSEESVTVNGAIPEGVTVKECPTDENGEYLTVTANGKAYYAFFSDGIYPKNMRVALYATPVLVSDTDGSVIAGKELVYSPWQYAINRFDAKPTEAQLALYTAMLDYAAAIQEGLMTEEEIEAAGGYADAYFGLNKYYVIDGVETLVESKWMRAGVSQAVTADKEYAGNLFNGFVASDTENISGYSYYPSEFGPGSNKTVVNYVSKQALVYDYDMEDTLDSYKNNIAASNSAVKAGVSYTADGGAYYNIVAENEENSYLELGRGTGNNSEYYVSLDATPRGVGNIDFRSFTVEFDLRVVDIAKFGGKTASDNWPIRIYIGANSADNSKAVITMLLYAVCESDGTVTGLTLTTGSSKDMTGKLIDLTANETDGTNSTEWVHFKFDVDAYTQTTDITVGEHTFTEKTPYAPSTADFTGLDYVTIGYRGYNVNGVPRYSYIRIGVDNYKCVGNAVNPRGAYAEDGAYTCDENSKPSEFAAGTDGKGYSQAEMIDGDSAWAIGHEAEAADGATARSAGFAYADSANMSKIYSSVDHYYASFDFMYRGGHFTTASPNGDYVFQFFFNSSKGQLFNITAKPTADKEAVVFGGQTFVKDVWYHIELEGYCNDSSKTNAYANMIVNGTKYERIAINVGDYEKNHDGTFGRFRVGSRSKAYAAHVAVDNVNVGVVGTKWEEGGQGKYASLAESYTNMEALNYSKTSSATLNESGEAKNYMKLTDVTDTEGAVNRVLEVGKTAGAGWANVTIYNNNKPETNTFGETHVFETDFMWNSYTEGSIAAGNYVYTIKVASSAATELEIQFMRNSDGTLYPNLHLSNSDSIVNTKYSLEAGKWYNIRLEFVERASDGAVIAYLYVNDTCVGCKKLKTPADKDFKSIISEVRGGSSGTYVESFNAYLDNVYLGTIAP